MDERDRLASMPKPTPERVVFGKHSLMEHVPSNEQPWSVMRYVDELTFSFHYREDAEQFMALTEEGYDFSAAKTVIARSGGNP